MSERVWGVKCPDGEITQWSVHLNDQRLATEDAEWLDRKRHCLRPHVVVYADIEWKEETE